jgi:hypothetical protein
MPFVGSDTAESLSLRFDRDFSISADFRPMGFWSRVGRLFQRL